MKKNVKIEMSFNKIILEFQIWVGTFILTNREKNKFLASSIQGTLMVVPLRVNGTCELWNMELYSYV